MTPEGRIKREVDKVLSLCGKPVWIFKPVQFGYGERALDYVGCVKGRAFAVETKAPGHKPTKFQKLTISSMTEAGMAVFVISDMDEVNGFARWLADQ